MLVRWNFTVCSVTQSSLPMAEFERPRATAFRIPSSRSMPKSCLDVLRIAEDREHDDLHLRTMLADPVQAQKPVHLWHPHVEQDDVGTQPTYEWKHLAPDRCLPDDLDVFRRLEGMSDALDHQAVIVRNKNLHGRSSPLPLRLLSHKNPNASLTSSQHLFPHVPEEGPVPLDLRQLLGTLPFSPLPHRFSVAQSGGTRAERPIRC